MQALQAAYRATVMIGTLVVGALAYRAYGPQLETLTPLVGRLQELAAEVCWPASTTPQAPDVSSGLTHPDRFVASASPLAAIEPPQLLDANVQPAASWDPPPPPATRTTPSAESPVAVVIRELNERGVSEYSLNKWGSSGEFYRFYCSAPWGDGGRYIRQFEAVAADPAEAAERVLQQVAHWQSTLVR